MGGIDKVGDAGISRRVGLTGLCEFVFKLKLLGLRFMAGIIGLINDGEEGSEVIVELIVLLGANGACIDRPFMLRGLLGPGDVMGRTKDGSDTVRAAMEERPPNVGPAKEESGIKLTGESGDDDGD